METQYKWWQSGVVYQIYPRSFQDSNSDGIGDLRGIQERLPYLKWLGIDAIWISPIYPSPMADFGYDISDYKDIWPTFGTLDDFDSLLSAAHKHDLKMILDLVPNHTSNEHPWFQESRSSRDNAKRDWYIWADPSEDGGPPNNWLSVFGGPAWTLDKETGQYYLHSFLREQPDLNWRNPDVHDAMLDVMRFWLDRGVDGFRVDVMPRMIKDELLRDDPANPEWKRGEDPYKSLVPLYSMNRPEVHDVIRDMRSLLDQYDDRMMVGEIYLPLVDLMKYYGPHGDEAHLAFNFELIKAPWDVKYIRTFMKRYELALPEGAWPNWVLSNHDRHRIASRVGIEQSKVAQMLLLTARGTPTCYYGDEIGMTDVEIPADKIQDPWGMNVKGLGLGRDPERTPMQWDASDNAGFSDVEPWLPVDADYKEVNVEVERDDRTSMLHYVQRLLALRRKTPALSVGSVEVLQIGGDAVLAYVREAEGARLLVALNFSDKDETLDFSQFGDNGMVVISTVCDREGSEGLKKLALRGNEGVVIQL